MTQVREDDADSGEGQRSFPPGNPLLIAWRRKPLLILGLIVGAVGGGLFASQRAPVYQSSAQVLLVKKFADGALPMAGGDPRVNYYDDYVSTHLALIRSQVVIDRAVKKHDLGSLPSFAGKGNPTGAIIGGLTVSRDTKDSGANNIINLSYKGPVSEDCRIVIHAVIDTYKDFLEETYRNVSNDTVSLITQARDVLQKDLAEKERNYAEFREKVPVTPTQGKDGTRNAQGQLGELEERRLTLRVRAAEIEERLKALEAAKKIGRARDVVRGMMAAPGEKTPANNDPERQLLALKLEEENLLKDYGEDHPSVQVVRKKIATARQFLSSESRGAGSEAGSPASDEAVVEAYARQLRQELADVKLSQRSLVELTAEAQRDARELSRYELQDTNYRNDIARTQQVYDQTLSRLKEINLVRDFGGYDARMISTPDPGGRIGTGTSQIVLAGAGLGLVLGIGLAYVVDKTDKRLRNAEEIRHRLGLPIVAHIPTTEAGAPSEVPPSRLALSLAIFHRPASIEAEAYRGLRTALYFGTQGEGHKVIQITSPNMGDGKSTIAANLAIAIAQSGKRIVLVDADMRRPSLHTLFGIKPRVGLSSVIEGQAELSVALADTGIHGLSLLPCGPRPENPAELLSQPQLDDLLVSLREQFDFVIVDTPPLLAVTDPAMVVSRTDGLFLTVRLGKNGRPEAERAREILHTLQANVLGVIVNDVSRGGGGYAYTYDDEYRDAYASPSGRSDGAIATATRKRHRKMLAGWFGRWLH